MPISHDFSVFKIPQLISCKILTFRIVCRLQHHMSGTNQCRILYKHTCFFLIIVNWREVPFLITIMNLAWKLYFFAFINLTLALNTKQSQSEYIIVKRIWLWFYLSFVFLIHSVFINILGLIFPSGVEKERCDKLCQLVICETVLTKL